MVDVDNQLGVCVEERDALIATCETVSVKIYKSIYSTLYQTDSYDNKYHNA